VSAQTLARLAHVSRARVTQIMDLLILAPDIQEAILFLPRTEVSRQPPAPAATMAGRPQLNFTSRGLSLIGEK